MKILLAEPRGFCAGVDRAIAVVEEALARCGPPVYVRHEIVHNKYVVEDLRRRGAVFVESVEEVPEGEILIFSAHGVSKKVKHSARLRKLCVIDATCPLVTKVHMELLKHHKHGIQVVLIGHAGHPEVEGTMGQAPEGTVLLVSTPEEVERLVVNDPERLAYITQTTLSVDDAEAIIAALKRRFPYIRGPRRDDICYATTNRQMAVKMLASRCELVLVLGSRNSSNSNRLREVAERSGAEAHLIDDVASIQPSWLTGVSCVGVTAGASAPEKLVQGVITALLDHGATGVETLHVVEEDVEFGLPATMQKTIARHNSERKIETRE